MKHYKYFDPLEEEGEKFEFRYDQMINMKKRKTISIYRLKRKK